MAKDFPRKLCLSGHSNTWPPLLKNTKNTKETNTKSEPGDAAEGGEEQLEEDGAELAGHAHVDEEADGGVDEREKVHEVAKRQVDPFVEGLGGEDAVEDEEEALGKFGKQEDEQDGGELGGGGGKRNDQESDQRRE